MNKDISTPPPHTHIFFFPFKPFGNIFHSFTFLSDERFDNRYLARKLEIKP